MSVNLTIASFAFVRISPSQLIMPVKAFLKLFTLKLLPILKKKKKTASIQTIKPPKTKNYDFVNLFGVNTSFALKWTSKLHSRQVHQQCLQNNSLKCRFWLNIGGVGVGLSHGPSRIRVSWLGDNLKGFSPSNSARIDDNMLTTKFQGRYDENCWLLRFFPHSSYLATFSFQSRSKFDLTSAGIYLFPKLLIEAFSLKAIFHRRGNSRFFFHL